MHTQHAYISKGSHFYSARVDPLEKGDIISTSFALLSRCTHTLKIVFTPTMYSQDSFRVDSEVARKGAWGGGEGGRVQSNTTAFDSKFIFMRNVG